MPDETTTVAETEEQTPAPETEQVETQETGPSKAEAEAIRRAAEATRRADRLEAQAKKAKEDQAAEQGKWQELAQQREQELTQAREQSARTEREARVTRLAGRAKFIDPADVVGRLSAEDAADDASVEAALERIAKTSPHLVAKEPAATPEIGIVHKPSAQGVPGAPAGDGKPPPPAGKAPLTSLDEYEALPQAERMTRMAEMDWLYVNEK